MAISALMLILAPLPSMTLFCSEREKGKKREEGVVWNNKKNMGLEIRTVDLEYLFSCVPTQGVSLLTSELFLVLKW